MHYQRMRSYFATEYRSMRYRLLHKQYKSRRQHVFEMITVSAKIDNTFESFWNDLKSICKSRCVQRIKPYCQRGSDHRPLQLIGF